MTLGLVWLIRQFHNASLAAIGCWSEIPPLAHTIDAAATMVIRARARRVVQRAVPEDVAALVQATNESQHCCVFIHHGVRDVVGRARGCEPEAWATRPEKALLS